MMAYDISEAKPAFLNNDDLLRNIADIPWAKEELSVLQNKAMESYREILERCNAIKRNGKTDEENAEELAAAEEEIKSIEILALQAEANLLRRVVGEKEQLIKKTFEKKQQLEREFKSNRALMRRKEIEEEIAARPNKVYSNDPCPCGSGKKYKRCCGAQV
ncbi:MAG: SEC-C domain-containing protein [Lachnospiraceae bacterium]|nr:SEC-C domain-containing protein [Lachnospiraceae bacterium]